MRLNWSRINTRNVTHDMSAVETHKQIIADNPKYAATLKNMTPVNVRKYWLKRVTPLKQMTPVNRMKQIAEILSNMDSQKAANILRHF